MNDEEIISLIALTKVHGLGSIGAKCLLGVLGSAVSIFREREHLRELVPGLSKRVIEALNVPEVFVKAEKEFRFAEKNQINCISMNDGNYPSRLRECDDAPVLLYFKGKTDMNALRVINMVGTRNATEYGKNICQRFLHELKEVCPEVLVVSGLAYGIDIYAHRAALSNHLDTIGVLAHGLDRIYPSAHRSTAVEMLEHGGLLTEYMSGTNPDRQNFVCRNRIVAGMSDATIVVESAVKGGALITAEIAESYHRDCFAFPGRIEDELSQGCNNLIRSNKAALIQSAEDFVKAMCWDSESSFNKPVAVQRELFPELTEDEQLVVNILKKNGGQQINTLVVEANISINRMTSLLFELEMKGVVRALAGGMYQLL